MKTQSDEKQKEVKPLTQAAYPTEPGTCIIQGFIVKIYPVDQSSSDEPCKSFPCKADVVITKTRSCGFGVNSKPVEGDTILVNFVHSIASSEAFKNVYKAQVYLPGLLQDQLFDAQIRIKMLPMDKFAYEIGNYEIVR